VPLDKLAELYGFEPPRWDGLTTVDACQGILKGEVEGFVSLGGNFLRAVPDHSLMEPAWSGLRLSVQIATKLNRTHVFPGKVTYLLPCLGRIEIDHQATGPQAIAMEDSTTCIHGSRGQRKPVAENLLSEPAIIGALAKATSSSSPKVDWDAWTGDYSLVRDAIERTYPDQFKDFYGSMFNPGGFPRPLPARERKWKTQTGKANFTVPKFALQPPLEDGDIFELMTMRADGQFNTTIYNEDDRFRGISGGRYVVFMNEADAEGNGLRGGDLVTLTTVADDGLERSVSELQVVLYDIPRKCLAGYYPELNALIPLLHFAEGSKVPAAKSIPVRIAKDVVSELPDGPDTPLSPV
jgi:molybdopterin-dependent oxidoreductase alpha subunit